MTPRISKAIDIFLDAINEGTLAKGTCCACAVGNLVAYTLGIKPVVHKEFTDYLVEYGELPNTAWRYILTPNGVVPSPELTKKGMDNIIHTGFSVDELKIIEREFEKNTYISYYTIQTKLS